MSVRRLLACLSLGLVLLWKGTLVARAELLRLATYNVENYTVTDRQTRDGYRPAYPKPEDAKRALRTAIRAINADVLALQEMGGRAFLEELRRDLAGEGLVYPHAEIFEHGEEPRYVAVLSKRPFASVRRHADLTFRYFDATESVKRGLLELRFAGRENHGDVTLFVAHLKSRFTDRRDDPQSARRREGEAVAIRDRLLERFPDPAAGRFLLVGDFNDGPTSRTVRALSARGRTEILRMVSAADSRGETWTHRYLKEDSYTRVDHIFVSPGMEPAVRGGGARIHDGPGVANASDHRPVVVELTFP